MTENKIQNHNNFIFLCCLVYFTSYLARVNFGAVLVEMVIELGVTSANLSLAVTASFISYGIGQLVSGFMGDKFNPKYLVTLGLIVTAVANILVGSISSVALIILVWTLNGFAQSLLWPPLVKIMAVSLEGEHYKKCCAYVTASASVATILIYLIAPLFVSISTYRLIFFFSGLTAIIISFIWLKFAPNIQIIISNKFNENNIDKNSVFKIILSTGVTPILLVILVQGILRDGITTWMPTFINDIFKTSTSFSILSTVVLPIFCLVIILLTRFINTKVKNEMILVFYLWIIAFISGVVLYLGQNKVVIAVLTLSLLTACMHGINLVLIGNLPAKFVKYGKVSSVSGVLNSCTYIGSAISAYGIAKINELFGWNVTLLIWIGLTIIGGIICLCKIKSYNKT